VSSLYTNHCHELQLFPEYGINYMHCPERGILNLIDVRFLIGEWLDHVEGMAMCGVFGLEQLLGCEGAFSFMRVSKVLLGKMVWSSFRWLPAECSM
jgi:hypothetical protein